MKALIVDTFGPISNIHPGELPQPKAGPKEVLIEVAYAGVNFPDLLVTKGLYQFKPALPFAPGGEVSGIVREVGESVERFQKGDRVIAATGWGGFAEFVAIGESYCTPLPDDIDLLTGSILLETYATAYHALVDRANLQANERLVVLGAAGGTGTAALQLGKALGAEVIAVSSSEDKRVFCHTNGADHVVGYDHLKDQLKELGGTDVIFDPVGGGVSEPAFRSLRFGGRHLVIGFASGTIPGLPWNLPLLKSAGIIGVFWGAFWRAFPERQHHNTSILYEMLRTGKIRPQLQEVVPLEEGLRALMDIEHRRTKGKIAIQIAQDPVSESD